MEFVGWSVSCLLCVCRPMIDCFRGYVLVFVCEVHGIESLG
jgi:hypothetical protein